MAADAEVVAATFKVLVLGDSNVGKSSLIQSYSTNERPVRMIHTIGELISAWWGTSLCVSEGLWEHAVPAVCATAMQWMLVRVQEGSTDFLAMRVWAIVWFVRVIVL